MYQAVGTWRDGHAGCLHGVAGILLVPHGFDNMALRTNELDIDLFTEGNEIATLG